jgi:hypothetical protein
MKKIINFIIWSSANPKQISLTIIGLGTLVIPWLMHLTGIICELGHTCVTLNPTMLQSLFQGIADVGYALAILVGGIMATYGFARKLYLTSMGQNQALK